MRAALPAGFLGLLLIFGCRAPEKSWTEPTTEMQFVLLPAGSFVMGSPASEPTREPQEVQHPVRISRPLYVGRYEVTQSQWRKVMGSNPSWFQKCGPDCPVERVEAAAGTSARTAPAAPFATPIDPRISDSAWGFGWCGMRADRPTNGLVL